MQNETPQGVQRRLQIARLNKCAQILREAAKRYGRKNDWLNGYCQAIYTHDCGTPACAFGHYAAAHPKRFAISKRDGFPVLMVAGVYPFYGLDAAKEEFELSQSEVIELFGGNGCGGAKTALQAAQYIEKFIIRHGGKITKPKEKVSVKSARAERRTRR